MYVHVTSYHKAVFLVGQVHELVEIFLARLANVKSLWGPVDVDEVEGTIVRHGHGDVGTVSCQI